MTRRGQRFVVLVALVFAVPAMAQTGDSRITQLEQKLDALLQQAEELKKEIQQLKGGEPAVEEDLTAIDVATAAPVPQPAAPQARALNPDISVVGTFIGHAGDPFEERAPAELDEVEVALEAFIDPYAKGRFFIAVTPEEVDVEEGYAQFVTLPWGLTAKAGKTKATFGKANTWHTHTRPWIDQPLMFTRFLGEEGLADVGVSVSKSIDNPWDTFIEATGEVYSGDVEGAFGRIADNDLFYNAHLKAFRDLTENSNLEVGTSWARGTLPEVGGHNRLAGVDVTYRWKPLQRSIYNSFIVRFEGVANRRADFDRSLYGWYLSGDYQLARRWFTGIRLDRADAFGDEGRFTTRGASATLTFWPSEFSQVRGQYRRTKIGHGLTFDEFLFQLQFSIGAHGAHVF